MVNQYACNQCKRSFTTKQALAQHKKDVHNTTTPPINVVRGRGRGRGRARGFAPQRGDINPSRVPTTPAGTITVSGEDRLKDVDLQTNATGYFDFLVDADMTPRLASLSAAYQRITFLSIVFNVTAQTSSFTSGGYLAGFITDADDTSVTKQQLQSSQGSVVKRWYESCNVRMPRNITSFYTRAGSEMRLSSPGRFWLIVDSAPSVRLNVVISVSWRVTLSKPTYEVNRDYSFFMKGELRPKKDNYNLQWRKNIDIASDVDDCSALVPAGLDTNEMHFWRVPTFIVQYKEGVGDTGSIQAHFICYKQDKKIYGSYNGKDIITNTWQGDLQVQTSVPCGTLCKYVGTRACSENQQAGVYLAPPQSTSSDGNELHHSLRQITSVLEKLETKLSNVLTESSRKSSFERLSRASSRSE